MVLLGIILSATYFRLPYRSSEIAYYDGDYRGLLLPPTPNFTVGDIYFDVDGYNRAPELEPFRQYFRRNCGDAKGTDAAACMSEMLRANVPFGDPRSEFFQAEYSPLDTFQRHMSGMPGHCVTFSGLEAATLLSVGVPSAIVQVYPANGPGHNVISVWDDRYGWVLFDPLNGSAVKRRDHYASGVEAVMHPNNLQASIIGDTEDQPRYLEGFFADRNNFRGSVVFPEPWLYTRVGERQAGWPFRGRFLAFGQTLLKLGPVQHFIRYSLVALMALCGLYVLVIGSVFLTGFIRRRWSGNARRRVRNTVLSEA